MKIYNLLLDIFIFLLFSNYLYSNSKDTIHYTVLEDNPYHNNLFINLEPFNVDISHTISIDYKVGGDYYINKKFNVSVSYKHEYLNEGIISGDASKYYKKSALEGCFGFNLSDRLNGGSTRINLKTEATNSQGYGYSQNGVTQTWTTFINAPCNTRDIFSTRTGILINQEPRDVENNSNNIIMSTTSIFLGLQWSEINDLFVNVPDYNRSYYSPDYIKVFLDYIINTNTSYSQFEPNYPGEVPSYIKSNWGWRMGFYYAGYIEHPKKIRPISGFTGIEFGSRPGIKKEKGYFLITFGWSIHTRASKEISNQ